MITVKEADKIIFSNIKKFSAIHIPLQEAYGMVLREDLIADRDLPPFHRAHSIASKSVPFLPP